MNLVLDPVRETEITLAAIDKWLERVEANIAQLRADIQRDPQFNAESLRQQRDDDA